MTEEKQPIINPYGWRKVMIVGAAMGICTALAYDSGADGTRYMSAEEWSWFNIRLIGLYLAGNVSKEAVNKIFGGK